jgi:predicted  nucleic acid-binding Zn-ribbon protein
MGPTNVALVKLFQADQELRAAKERLEGATKNVRIQQRRVDDLAGKIQSAQAKLKEQQSHSANLDLDLKSRDAHIERLRTQQQTAKNNKEYQAFIIEISTAKNDRKKVEEEALQTMELVERDQADLEAMQTQVTAEQAKLQQMKGEIGDTITKLQGEIDALQPVRDEAAAAVPAKAREAFERLANHHEGEAMSALIKPDRRREEYACSACMMDLVTDVYNKLHTRDDLVFCPSCRRILYIPDDLPPELAVHQKKRKEEAPA